MYGKRDEAQLMTVAISNPVTPHLGPVWRSGWVSQGCGNSNFVRQFIPKSILYELCRGYRECHRKCFVSHKKVMYDTSPSHFNTFWLQNYGPYLKINSPGDSNMS